MKLNTSSTIPVKTNMHCTSILLLWRILSLSISGVAAAEEKHQLSVVENGKHMTCYQAIGCMSLKWPWTGFWRRSKPRSPTDLQIQFSLVTRQTPEKKPVWDCKIELNNAYEPVGDSLAELDYDAERPYTVFHFWGCSGTIAKTAKMSEKWRKPYLNKRDVNLIFVLWPASILKYHRCVSDTRTVAAVVSNFIEAMIQSHGLKAERIHLVGESIGAHICGYIGKKIPKIHRITALDPAQPAFEGHDSMVRLDSSDATHVDVLHTNAIEFRLFRGFGFVDPIGDVDFYFNNGAHQPGCKFRIADHCSHVRANEYWMEALTNNDCVMWGIKKPDEVAVKEFVNAASKKGYEYNPAVCESDHAVKSNCAPLGWNTFDTDVKGVFHIKTKPKYPFCINGV